MKPTVLVYADTFFPLVGGCERISLNLAKTYKSIGYNVSVAASYKGARDRPQVEIVDGVEVARFNYSVPKMVWKHLLTFPVVFPMTMFQLLTYFQEKEPDLIIQNYLGSNSFYLWCIRKIQHFLGIKKFVWVAEPQGSDIQERPKEHKFHQWMVTEVLKDCDYVAGSSPYVLEESVRLAPEVRAKSHTLWTPIALEDFIQYTEKHKHHKPYILCLGRFVKKKGQDLILCAFAKLKQDIDLILVGFGPEEGNLRKLVGELNIQDRVIFVNGMAISRQETVEYVNGCEVATMPSRLEVFGQTGVEAMAAGKVLVGTFVDGFPQVSAVKNKYNKTENCILTDPTAEGVQRGLEIALDMTEGEKKIMTAKAKEFVFGRYSYKKACEEYLKVYQTLRPEAEDVVGKALEVD